MLRTPLRIFDVAVAEEAEQRSKARSELDCNYYYYYYYGFGYNFDCDFDLKSGFDIDCEADFALSLASTGETESFVGTVAEQLYYSATRQLICMKDSASACGYV